METTIKTYIRSYEEKSLEGWVMGFSTGAPEHLSQAQLEQLKNTIIKYLPHQVRFTAKHNWTTSSGSSG